MNLTVHLPGRDNRCCGWDGEGFKSSSNFYLQREIRQIEDEKVTDLMEGGEETSMASDALSCIQTCTASHHIFGLGPRVTSSVHDRDKNPHHKSIKWPKSNSIGPWADCHIYVAIRGSSLLHVSSAVSDN